jgi:phosphatidylinositol glycan class F
MTHITSKDRPQHPFLDALTLSPVSTLACICVGAMMLQSWWGGWVRSWWIDFALQGAEVERRIDRARIDERKFTACTFSLVVESRIQRLHRTCEMRGLRLQSHPLFSTPF